jgi:hypothetical protein
MVPKKLVSNSVLLNLGSMCDDNYLNIYSAEALKDPSTAAKIEAKMEHMLKVGEDQLKNTAGAAMEQAMADMTNPEMMAQMATMLKDPKFQAQVAAMQKDPSFKHYVSAVR